MPKRTPPNPHNRVRDLRQRKGWTQQQLADEAGINVSTIQRIESARYKGFVKQYEQGMIAKALGEERDAVFPQHSEGNSFNRREFLENLGIASASLPLISTGTAELDDAFGLTRKRYSLSTDEVEKLIQQNHATWEEFNTLHIGASLDYAMAIGQGMLVTLSHLTNSSIPLQQKNLIRLLLGDMHLLVGRLSRETHNFGDSERHFQVAMSLGRELENADLKTASREYYGYLLTDQELYLAAKRNGEAILEDAQGASFPIWAEAQLTAAYALSYAGEHKQAFKIAKEARDAHNKMGSELQIGHLTNPDIVHSQFSILGQIAAGHHLEAAKASEEGISNLNREQPHNTQFRARLLIYFATALWELGDVNNAVSLAQESLQITRQIGSILNTTRIEKLYHKMQNSPFSHFPNVIDFREALYSGDVAS